MAENIRDGRTIAEPSNCDSILPDLYQSQKTLNTAVEQAPKELDLPPVEIVDPLEKALKAIFEGDLAELKGIVDCGQSVIDELAKTLRNLGYRVGQFNKRDQDDGYRSLVIVPPGSKIGLQISRWWYRPESPMHNGQLYPIDGRSEINVRAVAVSDKDIDTAHGSGPEVIGSADLNYAVKAMRDAANECRKSGSDV